MIRLSRNATDIICKHLTAALPGETLSVLGLQDVHVVRALPTEIDQVIVSERRTDFVLELQDGTLLHLEYQKKPERNLMRFLTYDIALAKQFRTKVRTVVLYTGNVKDAPDTLDMGGAWYRVHNVFLNRFDGDAVLHTVGQHLDAGEWEPADRIRLAFALHMRFKERTRDQAFESVLELILRIPDDLEKNLVVACILGLTGRWLTPHQERRLKEAMEMTELLEHILMEAAKEAMEKGHRQGFEEGRRQGLERGLQQGIQQGIQQGLQMGEHQKAIQIAEKMYRRGASVSDVVELTGLTEQEADAILRKVSLS
ncbi:transposase [Alicyclobacillus macrosporangiidus]|uniref:Transposase (putative) YhgA-like domain-containing protein n=1 Tax=Alicyclobacillus macrosporangiidus TaxID=392015 RepID=A0A1I7KYW8_9BACL|nr:transposase [Alicyclobacillus macrosporangiidus]SFV02484.1 hypothetical protein SAMN05421543_12120 [Alicyclobacillus macrosporangiidus]